MAAAKTSNSSQPKAEASLTAGLTSCSWTWHRWSRRRFLSTNSRWCRLRTRNSILSVVESELPKGSNALQLHHNGVSVLGARDRVPEQADAACAARSNAWLRQR